MTAMVSYLEWTSRYCDELVAAGVSLQDARIAVLLGWNIVLTHQAAYGADSQTPVNFSAGGMQRIPGVLAACGGGRFGGPECYVVYASGLTRRFQEYEAALDGLVPLQTLIAAVAVHEVRHRVQLVEAATLRMFRRHELAGFWPEAQAALVAQNMYEQFREDEKRDRESGVSEEDLAWMYSDDEYDAAVVERLYIHRYDSIITDAQLGAFVRGNRPRVL